MLRLMTLLLALLNLAVLAWGQGWLSAYGLSLDNPHEPERLARQIRPEAITLLDETQLQALLAAERAQQICLQSDVLERAQAERVRAVLGASWPEGSWLLDSQPPSERWVVYMGRYPNDADLTKKREQLQRLKVQHELVRSGDLAPGLSLGSFAAQAQADALLQKLAGRGVHSARVLQTTLAPTYRLRLPALGADLTQRLEQVRAQLPALSPCAPDSR